MVHSKAKKILLGAAFILAAGTAAVVITVFATRPGKSRQQRLSDGSMLVLNRVQVGSNVVFSHGPVISQLLGGAIPTNGLHLGKYSLDRATQEKFDFGRGSYLVAEFRLTGSNAPSHPLVTPAFYRQFRFVVYGEQGIEFVEESWGRQFRSFSDGYFGYIATSTFPRDARMLGIRVERRETQEADPGKSLPTSRSRIPSAPRSSRGWPPPLPSPIPPTVGIMCYET